MKRTGEIKQILTAPPKRYGHTIFHPAKFVNNAFPSVQLPCRYRGGEGPSKQVIEMKAFPGGGSRSLFSCLQAKIA
jgi:hypothetical protein